jgi:hypothetical protein
VKVDLQYKVILAKLMRRLLKIPAYDKFKICHKINYKINWSSTTKILVRIIKRLKQRGLEDEMTFCIVTLRVVTLSVYVLR